jgi:transcriptional regulator with XRE-family HTH domain
MRTQYLTLQQFQLWRNTRAHQPSLTESESAFQADGPAHQSHTKMRGYSQAKLGSLIGLSFQQVQKYENGTNRVSIPVLMQICEVLDAHPMDIIGEGPQDGRDKRVNDLLQRLEAAESKLKILQSKLARMQKIFAEPD